MSPSEVWAPATQQAPPPPSQVQALVWHLLQTRGGLSLELPGCGTLLYPRNGSCLLNDSIWDPKFPLFLPSSYFLWMFAQMFLHLKDFFSLL